RDLTPAHDIVVQRARSGDHFEDLPLLERKRIPPLEQPDLHAIRILRVRNHLALDLTAAPEHDRIGPSTGRLPCGQPQDPDQEPGRLEPRAVTAPPRRGHDVTLRSPVEVRYRNVTLVPG